jgi:hypothetical protein
MTDFKTAVNNLEAEIIAAHQLHYEHSTTGLIIPTESPNGNTIYHLYSDGEITFQKGGWAYGQRSEFTLLYSIKDSDKLQFTFLRPTESGKSTYVILTEQECRQFREKMIKLLLV